MTAPVLSIFAFLACAAAAAASVAQQEPSPTQTLDEVLEEVTVPAPADRNRERVRVTIQDANDVTVGLKKTINVHMRFVKEQTQVVFRRESAARQLPEAGSDLYWVNGRRPLDLLPDRLIALHSPWIVEAGYLLAANIDEADGLPAHITFGTDVALVNLDHLGLRDGQRLTRIALTNAMHPQTRKCESEFGRLDLLSDGTSPYFLLGNSLRTCDRAVKQREGDLLFAENVPSKLRQAVQELYDPIASRLANRLGSEPGNLFVAWWPDSPHDGYRLQLSWSGSLLLFNGFDWQHGIDTAQRESLSLSFMREQIQRRIRETDGRGPFTQSAISYLLLLTLSADDHTTPQRLSQELPTWITGCAGQLQSRGVAVDRKEDVSSLECGLVLQFVYDAVARSRSAGKQNIYSTWRKLLDASFRRGAPGTTPADFLSSSIDARRISQGLIDGSMDWPKFAAALDGIGVKLNAIPGGALPAFEVQSLEHFRD